MLKIEAAKDDRTEKEILEVEEFWGEKAPAYPGWEWVEVPVEVRKKVSSYHRMARLQLEAPPVDWNAPETSLGIRDAVDGHSHLAGYPSHPDKMEELERTLDRAGVKYIINLSLEVYWDEYLREVEQGWLKSRLANRVVNLTTFDWTLDEQGWVERGEPGSGSAR